MNMAKPKVGDVEVSVSVEDDVVRLEVTFENARGVEVVKFEGDIGGMQLGDGVKMFDVKDMESEGLEMWTRSGCSGIRENLRQLIPIIHSYRPPL
jgi:hypothetical protein